MLYRNHSLFPTLCVRLRGNLRATLLLGLIMAGVIAADIIGLATIPNIASEKAKWGAGRLPIFVNFAVSPRKRANCTYVSRATRTARAVCSAIVQL